MLLSNLQRMHCCVHPKCLGFETQGVYANVADRHIG